MKYYLYRFSDNWADEMDLEGFAILTQLEKDVALASIKKKFRHGGTIGFGTNEDNEYNSLSEVMACTTFKSITAVEYNAIKKAFGGTSMGETGPLDTCALGLKYDINDEDEVCCENCGDTLDDDDGPLCSDCELEEDDEECEECGDSLLGQGGPLCSECRCEECGDSLNGEDGPLCSDCEEDEADEHEDEFKERADIIRNFIKKEYGLEESEQPYKFYSKFTWKPTPKTEIEIIIEKYDGGDQLVEITLKFNSKGSIYKELSCENFEVDECYNRLEKIGRHIKGLIEKAKKY